MKKEELKNESMCALFAPDGEWQRMTLSPDFQTCIATIKMLHKCGMAKSYHTLSLAGFKIMPVKVTIVQDGTEEDAFNRAKAQLS